MLLPPAGRPQERHVWSFAIGWRASKQCWGVTAGKPRHNSSNVRDVTAGKIGCNSSNNINSNYNKNQHFRTDI